MPRTLFDQVLVTETPRRTPRWMRLLSLGLHLVGVLLLLVLPITAAFDLPSVYTRLPNVMLASVPSPPPAARPPAPATPAAPSTAPSVPITAPDGIHDEVERPAPVQTLGVPGGVDLGMTAMGAGNLGVLPTPPPPPTPQPVVPLRIGGDVRPPERTHFVAPVYPPAAQSARMEGTVILEAVIDAQGVVQDVKILRSVPLLDRAAIDAVRQWRYTPTRLNGVAMPIVMTVTVTFSMRR
jgi:protein TonB